MNEKDYLDEVRKKPTSAVIIDREEPFFKVAKELNDKINALNLGAEEHNALVDCMIRQVTIAELRAFNKGLTLGIDYARSKK